jgi:hypothetical protein
MTTAMHSNRTRTDERVDTLAALILVTDEQLADRKRVDHALRSDSPRIRQLVQLVFNSDEPSVEDYLASHDQPIAA